MSKLIILREGQELGKEMVCSIRFRKVEKAKNHKIMLGVEEIATSEDADGKPVRILQSANKVLITIEYDGFYNHIDLEEIVNNVMDYSAEMEPTTDKAQREGT